MLTQPTKPPYSIVAGAILIDPGGRVLLQHRTPDARVSPNKWSQPGGHIEPGESIDQTIRRELIEEIGWDAGTTLSFYTNLAICRNLNGTLHILEAPSAAPAGETIEADMTLFYGAISTEIGDLQLNEGDAIDFFTPSEALKLDLAPTAAYALPRFFASAEYKALISKPNHT